MISYKNTHESGAITGQMVAIIGLGLTTLIFGSVAIWAIVNYNEQKTDVDGRVAVAVAEAEKKQQEKDDAKHQESLKIPTLKFVGPEDYGRLSFDYPRTWSAYVHKDGTVGGNFEAFLNPVSVPPVSNTESAQFALRVVIQEKEYDQVVQSYESLVKKGDLKRSTTSSQGNEGTRLDGSFNKNIRGAAVIYKVRDKTITIRTDADTFKPDFEKLIKTIEYNV